MSTQPDLSTLPQRMRYAATVLQEASRFACVDQSNDWTPAMLLNDAATWEADAKKQALIECLANQLFEVVTPVAATQWPWHTTVARKLIESGWRKGDPA